MTRWMSCEAEEVGRSISVFYGNADWDFVGAINLSLIVYALNKITSNPIAPDII
jgi:hypothetical protein